MSDELRALRRAEDALDDAYRARRGALWVVAPRLLAVALPLTALMLGVQAAILDGLDPGPDTRAIHGALLLVCGAFTLTLGVLWVCLWLGDGKQLWRDVNGTIRHAKRAVRDRRDDVQRGDVLPDAERIVADWTPPEKRS